MPTPRGEWSRDETGRAAAVTVANCVEAPPGRGPGVRRYFRSRASRDRNRLAAPGHRLGQAQGVEHTEPECGAIANTSEVRKSTRQQETKGFVPLLQPGVPTPKRASRGRRAGRHGRGRGCRGVKHGAQPALLEQPVVPASWRDTFRQARTGVATGSTAKAQDRNRISIRFSPVAQVRLARIAAMRPKHTGATVRTRLRPVQVRCQINGLLMLIQAGDAGYNSLHRLGSFYRGRLVTSHDSKGAPAYPSPHASRLIPGPVPSNSPTDLGIRSLQLSQRERDVTGWRAATSNVRSIYLHLRHYCQSCVCQCRCSTPPCLWRCTCARLAATSLSVSLKNGSIGPS